MCISISEKLRLDQATDPLFRLTICTVVLWHTVELITSTLLFDISHWYAFTVQVVHDTVAVLSVFGKLSITPAKLEGEKELEKKLESKKERKKRTGM